MKMIHYSDDLSHVRAGLVTGVYLVSCYQLFYMEIVSSLRLQILAT